MSRDHLRLVKVPTPELERLTMHLRFSKHEHIPSAGDEVDMVGMAGTYRVKVGRIIARKENSDHIMLKVQATRYLLKSK